MLNKKRERPEKRIPSKSVKRCIGCDDCTSSAKKLPLPPPEEVAAIEYEILKEENKIQEKEIEKYREELQNLISDVILNV